jgi:hypothetical protein
LKHLTASIHSSGITIKGKLMGYLLRNKFMHLQKRTRAKIKQEKPATVGIWASKGKTSIRLRAIQSVHGSCKQVAHDQWVGNCRVHARKPIHKPLSSTSSNSSSSNSSKQASNQQGSSATSQACAPPRRHPGCSGPLEPSDDTDQRIPTYSYSYSFQTTASQRAALHINSAWQRHAPSAWGIRNAYKHGTSVDVFESASERRGADGIDARA